MANKISQGWHKTKYGIKSKFWFFQASYVFDDVQQAVIADSIKTAIDIGYRHFDCAANYNNEKSVGKALNDKIAEGLIKRDEIFITSKVCLN